MEWTSRRDLTAVATQNATHGDVEDYQQNILARIALVQGATKILGGEGIYLGGARNLSELVSGGKKYPPTTLVIHDDSSYAWCATLSASTSISFTISTGSAKLYAVILKETSLAVDAAAGGADSIYFLAQASAATAPTHSILLGTGNVVAQAFVSFIYNASAFISWSSSDRKFILAGDTGSEDVPNKSTVKVMAGEGTTTVVQSPNIAEISINTNATSGMILDASGIGLKVKPAGGLSVDASGLSSVGVGLDFDIQPDLGSTIQVSSGMIIGVNGTGPISTETLAGNIIFDLAIKALGSFEISSNLLKVKKASNITQDSTGLKRTLGYFRVRDSGAGLQTIDEKETLYIQGNTAHAISGDTTNGNDGTLELVLSLIEGGGIIQDSYELEVSIDSSGGITNSGGLALEGSALGNYYGAPTTGAHVTGEKYRDAGGAVHECLSSGTPGTWRQLNPAISYSEDSGDSRLPIDSEFEGNNIPTGYICRWASVDTFDGQEKYTFPWIWSSNGYWYSSNLFNLNLMNLYSTTAGYSFNVTNGISAEALAVMGDITFSISDETDSICANVAYIGGYFAKFYIDSAIIVADSTINCTASLYHGNVYDQGSAVLIGTITVTNGYGTANFDTAIAYEYDDVGPHLFAIYDIDVPIGKITEFTAKVRYIEDPDGVV